MTKDLFSVFPPIPANRPDPLLPTETDKGRLPDKTSRLRSGSRSKYRSGVKKDYDKRRHWNSDDVAWWNKD